MDRKKFAPVFVIISGFCWACTGIFVRAFNTMGMFSMQITEMRSIATLIIMTCFLLISDRGSFKIKMKDWWLFAGAAIPGMVLFTYCNFMTMEYSSLSVAAMLLYTSPIFVMIISVAFFGENLTKRKLMSLGLTVFGCFLVSGALDGGTSITMKAFIAGIISGFGYALYTLFTSRARKRGYGNKTIMIYTFLFAAIGGAFLTDFKQVYVAVENSSVILLMVLLHAVITTIAPNLLYTESLKHMEPGTVSIMASSQVVMAAVFGLIFFTEIPTLYGMIGMASVIGALVLLNIKMEDKR